jgi:hypothetical protein
MLGTPGINADTSTANASARFLIHCMTLNVGQSCKSDEYYKLVSLNPLEEAVIPFKVLVGYLVL